ncbi:nitrite reductase [Nocardioides sp. W7]|uniref:nitrite reductase n=1 Tax=Nocardioides sp. W7 TaxID=2931390 RepID=UPI001FD4FF8D|nr:nitrite reductase [Nocardioides sp. W7]
MNRFRPDRCPGALRPWPAADGLLVRLRLPGGRLRADSLRALVAVAERYGDGRVHVTGRSNLQIRALPRAAGSERLPEVVLEDLEATGLLPSRTHDLARNVMASPQSGLVGGRTDVRPIVDALDAELCGAPRLGGLPGRFLFVLDDGRGDLLSRTCDLGLVALDGARAQLRVGAGWGPVVDLHEAPRVLADLALRFLEVRGDGGGAPWHVTELAVPLLAPHAPERHLPHPAPPLGYGPVPGGVHESVPEAGFDRRAVERLCTTASELVVTPWRGVLIPEENR